MLDQQKTYDLDGKERKVTGSISGHQAEFTMEIIKARKLFNCFETDIAFKISTIDIRQALSKLEKRGIECKHP